MHGSENAGAERSWVAAGGTIRAGAGAGAGGASCWAAQGASASGVSAASAGASAPRRVPSQRSAMMRTQPSLSFQVRGSRMSAPSVKRTSARKISKVPIVWAYVAASAGSEPMHSHTTSKLAGALPAAMLVRMTGDRGGCAEAACSG